MPSDKLRLTDFSSGGGCGCKISPKDLESILTPTNEEIPQTTFDAGELLVGYGTKDDAAVMEIDDAGNCIVSTTDFFMPVVDDAFLFGKIAAVNAISDIYAMGARPCMALSILGWPLEKLPKSLCSEVIRGAKDACREAGIPLAGGHSIISQEPIFGLAVTGTVPKDKMVTNGSSKVVDGDLLFLTKPLGVGILTKGSKMGLVSDTILELATNSMTTLNKLALSDSISCQATAMTDVTGFGLLGHLIEMCEASRMRAELNFENVPLLHESVRSLSEQGIRTGGSKRNEESYGQKVEYDLADGSSREIIKNILTDPQTSGGLLIAAKKDALQSESFLNPVFKQLERLGYKGGIQCIGRITAKDGNDGDHVVLVRA